MHVADSLITGMTDVFRSPFGADKAQQTRALKEYYAALSGYSEAVLNETWKRLRIRHTKAGWPLPADIAKIASEVSGERAVKETNNISIENALASPEGQYALKNGAAGSFLNSVKQLGWIPNQKLTERIVRQKRYHVSTLDPYWVEVHQRREREMREEHMNTNTLI